MVDWRGQRRTNATHRSKTDSEARLARKGVGRETHLSYTGHLMMENRSGLCVAVTVDRADGHAERRCARKMIRNVRGRHRVEPSTVGLDTGYVDGRFLADLEFEEGVVPHVPMPNRPYSDGRRSRRCSPSRSSTAADARLPSQPTSSETNRADLRLDEDDRELGQDPTGRPVASPQGLEFVR